MTIQLPRRVLIREVGPREGFQSFHAVVATEAKLDLITAIVASGIQEIEVTSFVRPDRVPQLADAETLVAGLPASPDVTYTALYLNTTGYKRAEAASKLRNKGWLYTSPSNSFLKANSNTTIEESLNSTEDWCKLFRANGKSVHGLMISNAFGCAYEGAVTTDAVLDLAKRYQDKLSQFGESLKEICLADTVGLGNPDSVSNCIVALRSFGVTLSLHLHDTRGLGLVNAYTGLRQGVSIFESSVGGIGGCPFTPGAAGNVATEDLVYMCNSLGVETGVDLAKAARAAYICESLMGGSLPGRVYKTYPRVP